MSIAVTFPSAGGQSGTGYTVPEPGDVMTQSLTDYLVAIASKGLAVPTSADLDLGAAFGIKSIYFKSRTANPAASGVARLANADSIAWRNAANNADLALAVDAGNALTFGGANVTGNPTLEATSAAGQVIGAGATTIVVFGTVILDSDAAYNSGTGRYTIPAGKGGDYEVSALVQMNTTQAGGASMQLQKNAVLAYYLGTVAAQTVGITIGGTVKIRVSAGDILDIRFQNLGAGGQTLTAIGAVTYLTLKRIPT